MKLKERLERLLTGYNLCPKSYLSQNFLIDPRILSRMVREIGLEEKEVVVEIGAGTGILTSHLTRKAKKVLAVEIDEELCKILKDELKDKKNLEIVCKDVTELNLERLFSGKDEIKVAGNLPYHIASRLLLDLVRKKWWKVMIFTVQREVAERLLSPPGTKTRGALTIITSYFANVKKIIDVPPQAFYPAPKVSSTIIKITPNKGLEAKDEKLFINTVKASFSFRRKTLLNSVVRELNLSREGVRDILAKSGVSEKARAEELEVEDFIRISNLLPPAGGKATDRII